MTRAQRWGRFAICLCIAGTAVTFIADGGVVPAYRGLLATMDAVSPPAVSNAWEPPPGALGDFGCLVAPDRNNPADQVMKDIFVVSRYAPVDVGNAGDIDWRLDPYGSPSWRLWFHSQYWVVSLMHRYAETHDRSYLDRALKIAADWVRDVPLAKQSPSATEAIAHRVDSYTCLYELEQAPWLRNALVAHANFMKTHYSGMWNHGLDENLAMFGIGCVLGRRDFADFARARLEEMAPAIIDASGVSTEQAVGYHASVYARLGVVDERMRACGYTMPSELAKRRALMPRFLAYAATPAGNMPQLGDTYDTAMPVFRGTPAEYAATRGASGSPPPNRAFIFGAGYAFGRDTWYPYGSATYYALRFGPGRKRHGHVDHTSFIWYARGRLMLTEGGHIGYPPPTDPYRKFLRAPDAHNVMTVVGAYADHSAPTRLTASNFSATRGDLYHLVDQQYRDYTRYRSVLFTAKPDITLVFDRVVGGTTSTYQQLWHLPNDMSVAVSGTRSVSAVTADRASRLVIVSLPIPNKPAPTASVVKGRTTPIQGWVSPRYHQRFAAPVVRMTSRGAKAATLTALVVTGGGSGVWASMVGRSDGYYEVRITTQGRTTRFLVSPGGSMRRL